VLVVVAAGLFVLEHPVIKIASRAAAGRNRE
jgi:hypothetical protein